jgi:hypothetical protein
MLFPQTDLGRTETTEPAALRIKQRAEKGRAVEIRHAKPVEGAVCSDQSSSAPVADDSVAMNWWKWNRQLMR